MFIVQRGDNQEPEGTVVYRQSFTPEQIILEYNNIKYEMKRRETIGEKQNNLFDEKDLEEA